MGTFSKKTSPKILGESWRYVEVKAKNREFWVLRSCYLIPYHILNILFTLLLKETMLNDSCFKRMHEQNFFKTNKTGPIKLTGS